MRKTSHNSESTDPNVAAKILNDYIDMVMIVTSKELADTVNTIISIENPIKLI